MIRKRSREDLQFLWDYLRRFASTMKLDFDRPPPKLRVGRDRDMDSLRRRPQKGFPLYNNNNSKRDKYIKGEEYII